MLCSAGGWGQFQSLFRREMARLLDSGLTHTFVVGPIGVLFHNVAVAWLVLPSYDLEGVLTGWRALGCVCASDLRTLKPWGE